MTETDCPQPDWDWSEPIQPPNLEQPGILPDGQPNWTHARSLRDAGMSIFQIADTLGLSRERVKKHAQRNNWARLPEKPKPEPEVPSRPVVPPVPVPQAVLDLSRASRRAVKAVATAMESAAEQHVVRIKSIVPSILEEISRRGTAPNVHLVPTKELLQITQCLELADKVGRRSHGLDQGEGRISIGLMCTGTMQFTPVEKKAIEVES